MPAVCVQASNVDQKELDEWAKKETIPFLVGMAGGDEEKTRLTWGVKALPWLILTDGKHIVTAEGFRAYPNNLSSARDRASRLWARKAKQAMYSIDDAA